MSQCDQSQFTAWGHILEEDPQRNNPWRDAFDTQADTQLTAMSQQSFATQEGSHVQSQSQRLDGTYNQYSNPNSTATMRSIPDRSRKQPVVLKHRPVRSLNNTVSSAQNETQYVSLLSTILAKIREINETMLSIRNGVARELGTVSRAADEFQNRQTSMEQINTVLRDIKGSVELMLQKSTTTNLEQEDHFLTLDRKIDSNYNSVMGGLQCVMEGMATLTSAMNAVKLDLESIDRKYRNLVTTRALTAATSAPIAQQPQGGMDSVVPGIASNGQCATVGRRLLNPGKGLANR
eukprot:Clim_evm2s156 gene=Clim_evmTU2s156